MKEAAPQRRKTGRPLSFDRDVALRQAMLTFWRHGYETTSLTDLTAAMGITAPSLYTAYGDKKQLFLEAVKLYAGSLDDLEQALFEAPTARQAVETLLFSSATAFTGEETPRGCLLASATASVSREAAEVQAAVTAIRLEIRDRLAGRIRRDVEKGLLPDDTDVTSLANLVIALIQGMSVLARDGLARPDLLAMASAALRAWPPEREGGKDAPVQPFKE